MSIWGKLIGGATGLALGGPIGAILGIAAGHGVDKASNYKQINKNKIYRADEKEQIFATGVIALSAKLSKIDGRISKEEITTFKKIFYFPKEDEKAIAKLFNAAKDNADDFKIISKQIYDVFKDEKGILIELLNSLFAIAYADGVLHKEEENMLEEIAKIFGIKDQIESIKYIYKRDSKKNFVSKEGYYKVLGASPNDSIEEISRKYKKLIKEYHPDRLQGLGLPKDFIELANKKLVSINEAFNVLKNEKKNK